MIRLTRRYEFSASHRLHSPQLSDDANREVYGKCNNPYGHGHNYVIEVSVKGPVDPQTGLAVELGALDALVKRTVIEPFDHRNMNQDLSEFRTLVPTTENVAWVIDKKLRSEWPSNFPRLEKIRIAETERNIFEVHG